MSLNDDLKEPTFGPLVSEPAATESEAGSGWKGGAASNDGDHVEEDVSSPEEENESRIPGDPRDIGEQQPPTALEF